MYTEDMKKEIIESLENEIISIMDKIMFIEKGVNKTTEQLKRDAENIRYLKMRMNAIDNEIKSLKKD